MSSSASSSSTSSDSSSSSSFSSVTSSRSDQNDKDGVMLDPIAEPAKQPAKPAQEALKDSEPKEHISSKEKEKQNSADSDDHEDVTTPVSFQKRTHHGSNTFHLSAESRELQEKIVKALEAEQGKHKPDHRVVVVQFFINRIFKIDDVAQTVELDLYLKLNWHDAKWEGVSDERFQEDESKMEDPDWWRPGVEITNKIEMEEETEEEEAYWIEFPEKGILAYTQRMIGRISAPMDMHVFPFDEQTFQINFESFHWKAEDLTLIRLDSDALQPRPGTTERWTTLSAEIKLSEWYLRRCEVVQTKKYYPFEDRTYSQVVCYVNMQRDWWYYIQKVIVLLVILVIMSWIVMVFDPAELTGRTIVTVTLFLAAVAFNFVVSASLPKVSYMTSMDSYLLVSYLFISWTLLHSAIVFVISIRLHREILAHQLDRWSLVVYPTAFLLYNVFFFVPLIMRKLHKEADPRGPPQLVETRLKVE